MQNPPGPHGRAAHTRIGHIGHIGHMYALRLPGTLLMVYRQYSYHDATTANKVVDTVSVPRTVTGRVTGNFPCRLGLSDSESSFNENLCEKLLCIGLDFRVTARHSS